MRRKGCRRPDKSAVLLVEVCDDDPIGTIDTLLLEADECEIPGGLAATHEQRVGRR
jgi:hypothetical protein